MATYDAPAGVFYSSLGQVDAHFYEKKEMKTKFAIIILSLVAMPLIAAEPKCIPAETTIWFDAPARDFTESSPLGNGRLGAMMFGGVDEKRIGLKESSFCAAPPRTPTARKHTKFCRKSKNCCWKEKIRKPRRS